MEYKLSFDVNNAIYQKNPENSELGKKIVKESIDLINKLGFEAFTFKKLATEIGTTEASIYRYFLNKHRLLLYILNWYWLYLDFLIETQLNNLSDPKQKIKLIIHILTQDFDDTNDGLEYNKHFLHNIVISESSKVYLTNEIDEINKSKVFKPYKDLCAKIASNLSLYNKKYPYSKSLSSTLVETAHCQQYFALHLPGLTDINPKNKKLFVATFMEDFVFRILS